MSTSPRWFRTPVTAAASVQHGVAWACTCARGKHRASTTAHGHEYMPMPPKICSRLRRTLAAALVCAAAFAIPVRAADSSPPVILQWFESTYSTIENRTPDLFMAGYGAVYTPPPGRADQG